MKTASLFLDMRDEYANLKITRAIITTTNAKPIIICRLSGSLGISFCLESKAEANSRKTVSQCSVTTAG